jgi:hypothetical protein
MLISMTDSTLPNIDVGRDLQFADIIDDDTFTIAKCDAGAYCYLCQRGHRQRELTPLTPSSGVFTNAVRCDQDSPVYLCLEHIPHSEHQFEAFIPEVQTILRAAMRAKRALPLLE